MRSRKELQKEHMSGSSASLLQSGTFLRVDWRFVNFCEFEDQSGMISIKDHDNELGIFQGTHSVTMSCPAFSL